jgi:hypothetical protein
LLAVREESFEFYCHLTHEAVFIFIQAKTFSERLVACIFYRQEGSSIFFLKLYCLITKKDRIPFKKSGIYNFIIVRNSYLTKIPKSPKKYNL